MFVNKIRSISYGVFRGDIWGQLPEMKKYNLFFGWNGSGKTTISNMFSGIERAELLEGMEYDLEGDELPLFDEVGIGRYQNQIRVFNAEYVDKVVSSSNDSIEPIYYLGSEHEKYGERISELEKSITRKSAEDHEISREERRKSRDYDQFCTRAASNIKKAITSPTKTTLTHYNRRNLIADYAEVGWQSLGRLSSEDLATYTEQLNAAQFMRVRELAPYMIDISAFEQELRELLSCKVDYSSLDRFSNEDVEGWAEDGFRLHEERDWQHCYFCGRAFDKSTIDEIKSHFNDAYSNLINKLVVFENVVQSNIDSLDAIRVSVPSESLIMPLLREKFSTKISMLEVMIKEVKFYYQYVLKCVQEKKMNVLKVDIPIGFNHPYDLRIIIKEINQVIATHNDSTLMEQEIVLSAQQHIAAHHQSIFHEEYFACKELRDKYREESGKLTRELTEERIEYTKLLALVQEFLEPADEMTKELAEYLGRKDLAFTVVDDGYQITRGGNVAERLSEGEKTAIAFLYFLKSLSSHAFKIEDSVVVVDDPVSSLDSNALYRSFSFLMDRVEAAKQLIVLTHNFVFFDMTRRWLKHDGRSENSNVYAVARASYENSQYDCSRIVKASKLFKSEGSEYSYLFKKTYDCAHCNPDECTRSCYSVINIARRLLETFLSFRYPTCTSFLAVIKKSGLSQEQKHWLYAVLNDWSHGNGIDRAHYDFTLHSTAHNVMKATIDLIENEDPVHFNGMKAFCNCA